MFIVCDITLEDGPWAILQPGAQEKTCLEGYEIDTALVDSSYAQLGETLQASAEDGASSIDVAAYRSSNGQTVRLDPVQAKTVADRSITAAAVPGLRSWTVTVSGSRVTVTGTVSVQRRTACDCTTCATARPRASATFVSTAMTLRPTLSGLLVDSA